MIMLKTGGARCLRMAWNGAIAITTVWYLVEHHEATTSLRDALGQAAVLWQAGIALTHAAVAVLGALPERPQVLRAKGWLHIAAGTTLAGYGLGILLTPLPGETISEQVSTAVGLAFGTTAMHLLRWREIETEVIPAIYQLQRLAAGVDHERGE